MHDDRERGWAGGGNWDNDPPSPPDPPKPPPPLRLVENEPIDREPRATDGPRDKYGLVCGRFLPVHRGHQFILEFARHSVETLTVLVFAQPNDPIPGAMRVAWLQALLPRAEVHAVEGERPSPAALDFAERFRRLTQANWKKGSLSYFTSEPSGAAAARALDARLVLVDPSRTVVPISGTQLRLDVLQRFEMLPAPVRPAFVRRVALVGAESTGKSRLSAALAKTYQTLFVPEHARTVAESRGGTLDADGLALAVRGQIAAEEALAQQASRVLFCDTDVLSAVLWSERLFGSTPPWARRKIDRRPYDLYLVNAPDLPFVGARERDQPEARRAFHDQLVAELTARQAPMVIVDGDGDRRAKVAGQAVDRLLAAGGFAAARAQALFQAGKL
jgi:NadR type nicotinamide-nucleotide adenylyltransferase